MLEALSPYLNQFGALGVSVMIVFWIMRIEKSQAVVNEQHIATLRVMVEKMNGIEDVAAVRDEAANRRFTILERSVGIAPERHRL